MGSMDDILRRSLLFDFYGELLTDHQKNIYEASVSEDLSLSEIAAQEGISRQGVHDLINRTDKILENYEQKLHLVERFLRTKNQIQEIREASLLACGLTRRTRRMCISGIARRESVSRSGWPKRHPSARAVRHFA